VLDDSDLAKHMLYRMDINSLEGTKRTVERMFLTRQVSIAVAIFEDVPMILLNAIILASEPNTTIMVATFFSCVLLGNKAYPVKQTFRLRSMLLLIKEVLGDRASISETSSLKVKVEKGGEADAGGVERLGMTQDLAEMSKEANGDEDDHSELDMVPVYSL